MPPRPIAGPARSQVPVLRSSKCRLLVQPITGFMAPRPPTRGDSSLLRTLTRHPVPPLTRRVPSCRHAPKSRARLLASGTLPPGTVRRRLLVNHPSMCLTLIRPDRTSWGCSSIRVGLKSPLNSGRPGVLRNWPSPSQLRCVLDTQNGLRELACRVSEDFRHRIPAPRACGHGSRTHPSPPTLRSVARAPL